MLRRGPHLQGDRRPLRAARGRQADARVEGRRLSAGSDVSDGLDLDEGASHFTLMIQLTLTFLGRVSFPAPSFVPVR